MQVMRRALFASVLLIAAAAPSFADDHSLPSSNGWYVQAGIGGSLTKDQDFKNADVGNGSYEPDFGIGGNVEVGRFLSDKWRIGVSFAWARGFDGKIDFKNPATPDGNVDGHADLYTLHFNANYYLGEMQALFGPIQPFVGAGIGFTHFDTGDAGGAFGVDKTDTTVSGALRVGYDFKIRPGITLTSSYSLGFTGDAEFTNIGGFADTKRDSQVDFITFTGLRFDLD